MSMLIVVVLGFQLFPSQGLNINFVKSQSDCKMMASFAESASLKMKTSVFLTALCFVVAYRQWDASVPHLCSLSIVWYFLSFASIKRSNICFYTAVFVSIPMHSVVLLKAKFLDYPLLFVIYCSFVFLNQLLIGYYIVPWGFCCGYGRHHLASLSAIFEILNICFPKAGVATKKDIPKLYASCNF